MKTMYIDEIKYLHPIDIDASSGVIYSCIIDSKFYIFKKFYMPFDDIHKDKLDSLSKIKNKYIIEPQILIKDRDNTNRGYLTKTFNSRDISSLSNYIYDTRKKIKILKRVKTAIIEMNSLGIIHADLHPGNILFYKNNVKLCDFDSCKYMEFPADKYNHYSTGYLLQNPISSSIDIYNFNIVTASILYNVNWSDIFKFSYTFENKFNSDQKRIWQKVKTQELLTDKDFLINYY